MEKMPNITNYERNANQHYNEVPISHWLEWPSLKSLRMTNAGESVGKREPSLHCWWESKWVATVVNRMEVLQKLKVNYHMIQLILHLGIHPDQTLMHEAPRTLCSQQHAHNDQDKGSHLDVHQQMLSINRRGNRGRGTHIQWNITQTKSEVGTLCSDGMHPETIILREVRERPAPHDATYI